MELSPASALQALAFNQLPPPTTTAINSLVKITNKCLQSTTAQNVLSNTFSSESFIAYLCSRLVKNGVEEDVAVRTATLLSTHSNTTATAPAALPSRNSDLSVREKTDERYNSTSVTTTSNDDDEGEEDSAASSNDGYSNEDSDYKSDSGSGSNSSVYSEEEQEEEQEDDAEHDVTQQQQQQQQQSHHFLQTDASPSSLKSNQLAFLRNMSGDDKSSSNRENHEQGDTVSDQRHQHQHHRYGNSDYDYDNRGIPQNTSLTSTTPLTGSSISGNNQQRMTLTLSNSLSSSTNSASSSTNASQTPDFGQKLIAPKGASHGHDSAIDPPNTNTNTNTTTSNTSTRSYDNVSGYNNVRNRNHSSTTTANTNNHLRSKIGGVTLGFTNNTTANTVNDNADNNDSLGSIGSNSSLNLNLQVQQQQQQQTGSMMRQRQMYRYPTPSNSDKQQQQLQLIPPQSLSRRQSNVSEFEDDIPEDLTSAVGALRVGDDVNDVNVEVNVEVDEHGFQNQKQPDSQHQPVVHNYNSPPINKQHSKLRSRSPVPHPMPGFSPPVMKQPSSSNKPSSNINGNNSSNNNSASNGTFDTLGPLPPPPPQLSFQPHSSIEENYSSDEDHVDDYSVDWTPGSPSGKINAMPKLSQSSGEAPPPPKTEFLSNSNSNSYVNSNTNNSNSNTIEPISPLISPSFSPANSTGSLNSSGDLGRKLVQQTLSRPHPRGATVSRKERVRQGKWKRGNKIGSGSFGTVYMGMNEASGTLMAVKSMNIVNAENHDIQDLQQEIDVMRSLSHPNIVRYFGAELNDDEGVLNIFQEWVPGGSVASLLQRFGSFSLSVVRNYLKQTLLGLEYLHSHHIIHRDIKGGNILVDNIGTVKLADFGASKKMSDEGTLNGGMAASMKGTPYFMAPEVLSQEKYGRKADMWSTGGVAFQMITGDAPWKNLNLRTPVALFYHIQTSDDPPAMPENVGTFPGLQRVILKCFNRDPGKRPRATELLRDPFFNDEEDSEDESTVGSLDPNTDYIHNDNDNDNEIENENENAKEFTEMNMNMKMNMNVAPKPSTPNSTNTNANSGNMSTPKSTSRTHIHDKDKLHFSNGYANTPAFDVQGAKNRADLKSQGGGRAGNNKVEKGEDSSSISSPMAHEKAESFEYLNEMLPGRGKAVQIHAANANANASASASGAVDSGGWLPITGPPLKVLVRDTFPNTHHTNTNPTSTPGPTPGPSSHHSSRPATATTSSAGVGVEVHFDSSNNLRLTSEMNTNTREREREREEQRRPVTSGSGNGSGNGNGNVYAQQAIPDEWPSWAKDRAATNMHGSPAPASASKQAFAELPPSTPTSTPTSTSTPVLQSPTTKTKLNAYKTPLQYKYTRDRDREKKQQQQHVGGMNPFGRSNPFGFGRGGGSARTGQSQSSSSAHAQQSHSSISYSRNNYRSNMNIPAALIPSPGPGPGPAFNSPSQHSQHSQLPQHSHSQTQMQRKARSDSDSDSDNKSVSNRSGSDDGSRSSSKSNRSGSGGDNCKTVLVDNKGNINIGYSKYNSDGNGNGSGNDDVNVNVNASAASVNAAALAAKRYKDGPIVQNLVSISAASPDRVNRRITGSGGGFSSVRKDRSKISSAAAAAATKTSESNPNPSTSEWSCYHCNWKNTDMSLPYCENCAKFRLSSALLTNVNDRKIMTTTDVWQTIRKNNGVGGGGSVSSGVSSGVGGGGRGKGGVRRSSLTRGEMKTAQSGGSSTSSGGLKQSSFKR